MPLCGYCLEASMTGRFAPPVDSRLRGNDGEGLFCLAVILTFDPLPSRERGIGGCFVLFRPASDPAALWIADQVRNDVTMLMHRFHPHL